MINVSPDKNLMLKKVWASGGEILSAEDAVTTTTTLTGASLVKKLRR